jgi:pimeloyl-ACP methyl ester carboxylesterase
MNAALSSTPIAICDYRVSVPEPELEDLRQRLRGARFPDELPGVGWSYGVPLGYLRELTAYWLEQYDWREQERRLNALPQFATRIDGQQLHFIHARSPEPGAIPLLLIHGWPGSVIEFQKLIEPLTQPRLHGGSAADAFHVVCPSLPGFGFSGPTREPGWDTRRIARALACLMRALGYDRYAAHGGDFGAAISRQLGLVDGAHVAALHLTLLPSYPEDELADWACLTSHEKSQLAALAHFDMELSGYARLQEQRPQTLAYGLTDSPVGQLAFIVEKFKEWTDTSEVPEEVIDRDQLLTNVMLYWLTGTANSAARLFRESRWRPQEKSLVPTGVAQFPLAPPSLRRFAERDNRIVHWTEHARGGHFPAMEQPQLLLQDLRAFFGRFR